MKEFYAYHVVTGKPMYPGQRIFFDGSHLNGVGRRVREKGQIVSDIYAHPEAFHADELEHHTAVALRELALEQVRQAEFPDYPSRMACLYVSAELEAAERWFDYFTELGRPTFQIVKLKIRGRCFVGDANNCFRGQPDAQANLTLARHYWRNLPNPADTPPIPEMLVDGEIQVMQILKEKV